MSDVPDRDEPGLVLDQALERVHGGAAAEQVIAEGLRPGIDVVVATARASDQDPAPISKLLDWAERQR